MVGTMTKGTAKQSLESGPAYAGPLGPIAQCVTWRIELIERPTGRSKQSNSPPSQAYSFTKSYSSQLMDFLSPSECY